MALHCIEELHMNHSPASALIRAVNHLWAGRQNVGLAVALGRPHGSVRNWLTGRRNISAEILDDLAAYTERHARQSLAIAEELRRDAAKAATHRRAPSGWEVVRVRDPSGIPRDGRRRGGQTP